MYDAHIPKGMTHALIKVWCTHSMANYGKHKQFIDTLDLRRWNVRLVMKNILALVWWSDMHYATNTILSTWEKNSIFVEKCAQYLKFNFNFQFRLAKITSWAKNFVHPHLPESYPISLSWKQISFDLQTKWTPHRRKNVFFRALPKLPLPTRAGCRWRRQLDVQISLQHSTECTAVEVVRVACRPAFHIRQKVSKMRKSSPWLV